MRPFEMLEHVTGILDYLLMPLSAENVMHYNALQVGMLNSTCSAVKTIFSG
uniref:hypothetical protein n=1 Tax=Escherichia coli TaxID=562 RepID=UPI002023185B|nr:hypothetical protein [Escherichia coli]